MIDERLETQASLYALGALPPDELPAFEQALQSDRELQQLVVELREAAGAVLLASPAVQPPAHLKQKILARLESGAAPRAKIVPLEQPVQKSRLPWLPWALAACLAVVCGISIVRQSGIESSNGDLQRQITAANQQLREANERAANDRARLIESVAQYRQAQLQLAGLTNRLADSQALAGELASTNRAALAQIAELIATNNAALARVTELAASNSELTGRLEARDLAQIRFALLTTTNIQAVVAWNNREQKGLLQVLNMPPAPAGKDYQLWVIDKAPVSAGLIRLGEKGTALYAFNAASPIGSANKFAISLEEKGVVAETPSKDILVVSN